MPRNSLPSLLFLVILSAFSPTAELSAQVASTQVEFKKCWQFSEPNTEFVALSSDTHAAFLSTGDARVTSVALESGAKLWSSELGGSTISNLAVVGERLYLVAAKGTGAESVATLKILGKETGIFAKEIPLLPAERYFLKAGTSSLILVSSAGDIYSINTAIDEVAWHRKPTGSIVGKPHVGESSIVISSADKNLIRLDPLSGEIASTSKVETTPTVVLSSRAGHVFYGDGAGRFSSVTNDWTLRLGAQISDVFELEGSLIVTSFDNFVYRVNASDGDVRWRKRLAGRIAGTAVSTDRALLIFTLGEPTAILTEFKKGRTIGRMAIGEAVEAAVIPPTFASGSVVAVNGDALSFTTASCETKKASAASANALSKLPINP